MTLNAFNPSMPKLLSAGNINGTGIHATSGTQNILRKYLNSKPGYYYETMTLKKQKQRDDEQIKKCLALVKLSKCGWSAHTPTGLL